MSWAVGLGGFWNAFDKGYGIADKIQTNYRTQKNQNQIDGINKQIKTDFNAGVNAGQYQPDQFYEVFQEKGIPALRDMYINQGNLAAADAVETWGSNAKNKQHITDFGRGAFGIQFGDNNSYIESMKAGAKRLGIDNYDIKLINSPNGSKLFRYSYDTPDGMKYGDILPQDQYKSLNTVYDPAESLQSQTTAAAAEQKRQRERGERREDYTFEKQTDAQFAQPKLNISVSDGIKLASDDPANAGKPIAEIVDIGKQISQSGGYNTTPGISGVRAAPVDPNLTGGVSAPGIKPSGRVIVDQSTGKPVGGYGVKPEAKQADNDAKSKSQSDYTPEQIRILNEPIPKDWNAALQYSYAMKKAHFNPDAIYSGLIAFRSKNGLKGEIPADLMEGVTGRTDKASQADNWSIADTAFGNTPEGLTKKKTLLEQENKRKVHETATNERKAVISQAYDIWKSGEYNGQAVPLQVLAGQLEKQGIRSEELPHDMRRFIEGVGNMDKAKGAGSYRGLTGMLAPENVSLLGKWQTRTPQNDQEQKVRTTEQKVLDMMQTGTEPYKIAALMNKEISYPLRKLVSPEMKVMLNRYQESFDYDKARSRSLPGLGLFASREEQSDSSGRAIGLGRIPVPIPRPML